MRNLLIVALLVFSLNQTSASALSPTNGTEQVGDNGASLSMSLTEAVDRASRNNVMRKLAEERINAAKGRRLQDASDMLPHLSLNAFQGRTYWDNPATIGFAEFGVIGPYNSFDARVQLAQRVFDLSAFAKIKAANLDVLITRLDDKLTLQQVSLAAVLAYLDVLRAEERSRAVAQDILLAQELVNLAEHQLSAGVVTNLDVLRSKTRLAQEKARAQEIQRALDAARFQLERVVGVPLGSDVRPTDRLTFFEDAPLPIASAIETALKERAEMLIAEKRTDQSQAQLSAATDTRLPLVELSGNYGRSGSEPNVLEHDVAQIGVRVRMPVFEGGLIEGRIREARSRNKQNALLRDDMKVQIEEDVRLSLETLRTVTAQVKAAQESLDLATQQANLARNQYSAGLTGNIEVVDAQTTLERIREEYVSALAQYHMARVNYYSALGRIESFRLGQL